MDINFNGVFSDPRCRYIGCMTQGARDEEKSDCLPKFGQINGAKWSSYFYLCKISHTFMNRIQGQQVNLFLVILPVYIHHVGYTGTSCDVHRRSWLHTNVLRHTLAVAISPDALQCPFKAISRSSQCSTTGVTKTVVCVILSVG